MNSAILVLAGILAGISATVAGIASVWSYPALLLIGYSPIDANITNSISVAALGFGAVGSSKREWIHHKRLIGRLAVATALGGICGAVLLLNTSPNQFKAIVPYLILSATLLIWLPPRERFASRRGAGLMWAVAFVIGIYAGYFGAGSGIMTIVLLIQMLSLDLVSAQAIKNVLIAIGNTVAAIIFITMGHVHWGAVIPLAIGFYCGGYIGPKILRRTNQTLAKALVTCLGVGLSISLVVGN